MIPLYPDQLPATSTKVTQGSGTPAIPYFNLWRSLFLRTGGSSGIPFTVGANLTAGGAGQSDALGLVNDFNEVLNGSGGVRLAALSPGQFQLVFCGISSLNVYPAAKGIIDALAVNAPYSLANTKSQIFWCSQILSSGGSLYRSLQLG